MSTTEKAKVTFSLEALQSKLTTKLEDIKDIGVFTDLPGGVYLFAIDTYEIANLAKEGEPENYGIRTIVEVESCVSLAEVNEDELDLADADVATKHQAHLDEQIGLKLYKNYSGEKILELLKKDYGFLGEHFGLDNLLDVVEQAKGIKFVAEYVITESKKLKNDDGTPRKFGNFANATVA